MQLQKVWLESYPNLQIDATVFRLVIRTDYDKFTIARVIHNEILYSAENPMYVCAEVWRLLERNAMSIGKQHGMEPVGKLKAELEKLEAHFIKWATSIDTLQANQDELLSKIKGVDTQPVILPVGKDDVLTAVKSVSAYQRPSGTFFDTFPCLREMVELPAGCPGAGYRIRLEDAIITLNDSANWSRERIAEWIRQLEADGKINQKAVVAVD